MLKNLFKNKKSLQHTTDIHSHLIPFIDDGCQALDQSIMIITKLEEIGFKKIITTPHIMSHRFPNTKEKILKSYDILKNELVRKNINIDLGIGAEYYYDEHFVDLIKKDELLSFGDNYVLFEFSYNIKPFALRETMIMLRMAGYRPILAHPERYKYFTSEEDYLNLKDIGMSFQINSISTQGFYGKKVQKSVQTIIDLGLVDFIGSDIHSEKYLDSFVKSLQNKTYSKVMSKNNIKNDSL